MILVVGPTPSFQRCMTFSSLERGEINRASHVEQLASGKGVNCARVLARLGEPVRLLTFAGGLYGKMLLENLRREGISTTAVSTRSLTRSCCTVLEVDSNETTELIENAGIVSGRETAEFTNQFIRLARTANVVVFAGTLPAGVPLEYYATLLSKIRRRLFKVIVDTQGKSLLEVMKSKPDIVKVNREEWTKAFALNSNSLAMLKKQICKVAALSCSQIMVTNEEREVMWIHRQGCVELLPIKLRAGNPIGSGDSMCAGLAYALRRDWPMPQVFAFGLACGSANAASNGYGRIDPKLPFKLAKKLMNSLR